MKPSTLLAIVWTSALLVALPALAQEQTELERLTEERAERVERYIVRALTQKRLAVAVEFLESSEFTEARKKLEQLKFSRLNPYERALSYRFLAYAAIGQEDSEAAVDFFEKAVAEGALLISDEASVRFNVAQIAASLQQWEKVDETLAEWFKWVEQPNANAYYLLAVSRYQRELFDEALAPALEAIEISAAPSERSLQLAAALHLQNEDFDSAVPILEQLVIRFAKKQYWVQLSLIFSARGDYEEALRVQQIAYAQGLLTQDEELRRLARTYLFHQLPYPAAKVLEEGLQSGQIKRDQEVLELLGNSWIAAREYEKSIEPLQSAADLAEDGQLYMRLGQVRVQREDWKEATALILKAIEKGGLPDEGKAHMLLGISYYSDDQKNPAQTAFLKARKFESTRKEATAWLEHIARQSQQG